MRGIIFSILGAISFMFIGMDPIMGGIVGYVLGSVFSSFSVTSAKNNSFYSNSKEGDGKSQKDRLLTDIMLLAAMVMKADGNPTKAELNEVKFFLRNSFTEGEGKFALQQLKSFVSRPQDCTIACIELRYNLDLKNKSALLHFLCKIAIADGNFSSYELETIRQIAGALEIDIYTFNAIISAYMPHSGGSYSRSDSNGSNANDRMSSSSAYSVLGISSSASDSEVKKAYYKLAKQYHPDKFEGKSDLEKQQATEKFKQINAAYEVIKTARGIS